MKKEKASPSIRIVSCILGIFSAFVMIGALSAQEVTVTAMRISGGPTNVVWLSTLRAAAVKQITDAKIPVRDGASMQLTLSCGEPGKQRVPDDMADKWTSVRLNGTWKLTLPGGFEKSGTFSEAAMALNEESAKVSTAEAVVRKAGPQWIAAMQNQGAAQAIPMDLECRVGMSNRHPTLSAQAEAALRQQMIAAGLTPKTGARFKLQVEIVAPTRLNPIPGAGDMGLAQIQMVWQWFDGNKPMNERSVLMSSGTGLNLEGAVSAALKKNMTFLKDLPAMIMILEKGNRKPEP